MPTNPGLLTQRTDARGTFDYEYSQSTGRLETLRLGNQVLKSFSRSDSGSTVEVTRQTFMTSTDDYFTTYSTTQQDNGNLLVETRFPGSTDYPGRLVTQADMEKDGRTVVTYPDGSRTMTLQAPDPRYGMQVPFVTRTVTQTPEQAVTSDPTMPWYEDTNAERYEVGTQIEVAGLTDPSDPSTWTTLTRTTTVNTRTYTRVFDRTTRQWTTSTPAGRETTTTVDAQNRVTFHQLGPAGLLHPILYQYDSEGRIAQIIHGTGAEERKSTFTYDPTTGFPSSVRNPLWWATPDPNPNVPNPINQQDAGETIFDLRDGAGRATEVTQPGNQQVFFAYDGNGNVTSVTPPDRPAHFFDYSEFNQLSSHDPPLEDVDYSDTTYQYFLDRQIDKVEHEVKVGGVPIQAETAIDISYNAEGRPQSIAIMSGTTSSAVSYDITYRYEVGLGGIAPHTIDTNGLRLEYTYDGLLLKSIEWKPDPDNPAPISINGTVSSTYDQDYRVTSRTVTAGAHSWTIGFEHGVDPDGLLTEASHAALGGISLSRHALHGLINGTTMSSSSNALTTTRELNGFAEVDLFYATWSPGTVDEDFLFEEEILLRDALGRIVIKREEILGSPTTYRYRYDKVGRLTHVWEWAGDVATGTPGQLLERYTYGANGNRESAEVAALPGSGPASTAMTVLDTETEYDYQDRLTQYGSTSSYAWTSDGRLVSKTINGDETSYTYDVLGNLRRVEIEQSGLLVHTIEYIIDGHNRRIGKIVDGVLEQGFLYKDGLNSVAELDGTGNIVSRFVYASKRNVPDFIIKPDPSDDKVYRLITDHIGSVRLVVDMDSGEIVQRLDYDAFGRLAWNIDETFQPFGFAGGLQDPATGLVRFGARDYDPEIGRWTTKDPLRFSGGSWNLYTYVNNDPENFNDPSGMIQCGYEGKPCPKPPWCAIIDCSEGVALHGAIATTMTRPDPLSIGVGIAIAFGFSAMSAVLAKDCDLEKALPPVERDLPRPRRKPPIDPREELTRCIAGCIDMFYWNPTMSYDLLNECFNACAIAYGPPMN